MLDLRLIRENPSQVANELQRRGGKIDLSNLHKIATKQRELEEERCKLQAEGNQIGKEIGEKIRSGMNPQAKELLGLRELGNKSKRSVSAIEEEEKIISKQIKDELLSLPNIPSKDSPNGKDESDNKEIRHWGEVKKNESFRHHWEISEGIGIFDTERSVRISQSRFVTLLNQGAKLERALINFMLDLHISKGYLEISPPVLVNTSSLTGSGQLPKFAEESFRCAEDDLWLTPTAEVPITSFHRGEIIPIEKLPLKYVAHTPCFRREAGSYGRDTRGLIRLHQFNKVELYWFTHPEHSKSAHSEITSDAEAVLQALNLPYRVIELCTGDLGFSAAKTYDLEVWMPGSGTFREISSCSNCGDFQARRSSIRTKEGKKNKLIHTLNGSALAVGRTMAAVLENGQQSDGSVKIPKNLVPYFGKEELKAESTLY